MDGKFWMDQKQKEYIFIFQIDIRNILKKLKLNLGIFMESIYLFNP